MPHRALPRVEHAALLRAFDYVAAATFGMVAAVAAWMLVPSAPPALLEMVLGMALGMLSAIPLLGLFSWVLSGFELVAVSMQAGVFGGMVGALTTSVGAADVAFEGLLVGLLVQLVVHAVDRSIGGEVPPS